MVLAVLAVLIAPAAALGQALAHGWAPHGDDATIALRAADVLDGRFPLTGMRSTAGAGVDPTLSTHHLGPVQFYLLAVPLALAGGSAVGIALGGVLFVAVSSVLTVVWARRLGGWPAVLVLSGGLLLTQWAIGPAVMFRPLNPFAPLLPLYLALVLLWALTAGDRRALPALVVALSLLAQANLAFLPLAAALAVVAVVAVLGPGRLTSPRAARRVRRDHRLALLLGLLVWLPSIVELLVHRPNNLIQLVRWLASGSGSQAQDPIGPAAALQHLSLLAPVPGGFQRYRLSLLDETSTTAVVVGCVVLALLLLASVGWLRADGRPVSVWPARIALVANLAVLATASQLPPAWAPPYWVITWLPVVAFSYAALVWRVLSHLGGTSPDLTARLRLPVGGALVVGGVLAAALALFPSWTVSDAMTGVGRTAAASLGPGEGRAARITGYGATANLGAVPAVAWHLHRAGWQPHYFWAWPYDEGTEHLWSDTAPPEAVEVYVTDSDDPQGAEHLPGPVHEVDTIPFGEDRHFTVYRSE
ncbi:hypothetical protein [Janibacter corallicola]|uniref:hypothetical protein n=1 Tax=Janibacter corallicola TaxID=415212 RepID=UPI000A93B4C8|nr:hypothetical protein [Janibacter corallicola]